MAKKKKDEDICYKIWYKGVCIDVGRDWVVKHPGGDKILKIFHNRDASEVITATHSDYAKEMVFNMAVDSFAKENGDRTDRQFTMAAYRSDYLDMYDQMKREGMFEASVLWELFKATYSFGATVLGVYLCVWQGRPWLGAMYIAIGWFQLGWLGHDWSHHTFLPKSNSFWCTVNDWMAFLSCIDRGTTLLDWKLRHNTHHCTTNEIGNDPDIRLAPILNFFEDFAPNWVTKWQHVYYVPLISLLHVFWLYESYTVSWKRWNSINQWNRWWARVDMLSMLLHHTWVGLTGYYGNCFFHLFCAYILSGFLTAIIVFSSHYGEDRVMGMTTTVGMSKDEVMENFKKECTSISAQTGAHTELAKIDERGVKRIDLLEQTCLTVRNISGFFPNSEVDRFLWFHATGGLNLQFEHHLFPMMPRHNLFYVTPMLKKYCADKGLPYTQSNLLGCVAACVGPLYSNVVRNLERAQKVKSL